MTVLEEYGGLFKPDCKYTWSTDNTLELRLVKLLPGSFKQKSVDYDEPRERICQLYKPQDWFMTTKIVIPKRVEWAIGSIEPLKTPVTDGVYRILL